MNTLRFEKHCQNILKYTNFFQMFGTIETFFISRDKLLLTYIIKIFIILFILLPIKFSLSESSTTRARRSSRTTNWPPRAASTATPSYPSWSRSITRSWREGGRQEVEAQPEEVEREEEVLAPAERGKGRKLPKTKCLNLLHTLFNLLHQPALV